LNVVSSQLSWSLKLPTPTKKKGNKHCLKILQETPFNSDSNGLLPFMVGQSHDSVPTAECQNAMLLQHCHFPAGQ
jgi:hypothetical protein